MLRRVALALMMAGLTSAVAQESSGPAFPGEAYVDPVGHRAVLLADADLFEAPSTDAVLVARYKAGTVLDFVAETTDVFGRTWSIVRDPAMARRRRDAYLAPFDYRTFMSLGGQAAFLADRPPLTTTTAALPAARDDGSWWRPHAVLSLGHSLGFDGVVVGISALSVPEHDAREAIALLGGRESLGSWPLSPLPGELFVPERLPLLFQSDGSGWRLVQPVRLFGDGLNLLGNPRLETDPTAPPLAGGPSVPCWRLVGALDPTGRPAGGIAEATVVRPVAVGAAAMLQRPAIELMQPPAPVEGMVPPRLIAPTPVVGLQLHDSASRQAVYLEQTLGPDVTRRLRSRELVLDVWARTPAASAGAGTFGVDVAAENAEGGEAGGGTEGEGGRFATSLTIGASSTHVEFPFTVPDDADTLTIRLLPIDRSIAVEQQGAVILERLTLRRPAWNPQPPATVVPLNRVFASTYEGVPRYTRAPLAITERSDSELAMMWAEIADSGWSDDDKKLVLAGDVRVGMSPAQVRASWGDPAHETGPGTLPGIELHWDFGDRYAAFVDDKLVAYRPTKADEQPEGGSLRCAVDPGEGAPGERDLE